MHTPQRKTKKKKIHSKMHTVGLITKKKGETKLGGLNNTSEPAKHEMEEALRISTRQERQQEGDKQRPETPSNGKRGRGCRR